MKNQTKRFITIALTVVIFVLLTLLLIHWIDVLGFVIGESLMALVLMLEFEEDKEIVRKENERES